jgi:DNA repair protein RecN (Recombination protein N)
MALSRKRQVICITHLPQIAAMADAHFQVLKSADEKSTQVAFHALSPAESRDALAGMLSGAAVTASAGTHAEEMLALARAQKEKQRQEAKI